MKTYIEIFAVAIFNNKGKTKRRKLAGYVEGSLTVGILEKLRPENIEFCVDIKQGKSSTSISLPCIDFAMLMVETMKANISGLTEIKIR